MDIYHYAGNEWAPSYSATARPHLPSSAMYNPAHNSSHRYNGETRSLQLPPSRTSLAPHKLTSSLATLSNATAVDSDFINAPPTTTSPPLSQPEMVAKIKKFLEMKVPAHSLELNGMSWEEFEKLREEARSIPGWNKVSVDFIKNKKCLIQYGSGPGHEIMNSVFIRFLCSGAPGSDVALEDLDSGGHINSIGSADIELVDGLKKSPDYSFADSDPNIPLDARSFPTIIWEVAVSESSTKLAIDCGRFIACSQGRGLLAIGIDIKRSKEPGFSSIRCSMWELDEGKVITPWPPTQTSDLMYGRDLDTLYRSDTDDLESVLVPAKSFFCISQLGTQNAPETIAFYAKELRNFSIYPEDPKAPPGIKILHRHWYRLPDEAKADDVFFEIPCSLMLDVALRHQSVAAERAALLKRKNTSEAKVSLLNLFNKRIKLAGPSDSRVDQPQAEGSAQPKKRSTGKGPK